MGMLCPFVARECVKDDCVGWVNGDCFVKVISGSLLQSSTPVVTKPTVIYHPPGSTVTSTGKITALPLHPDILLGVDFGTAYSKVTLRNRGGVPQPLKIGDPSGIDPLSQYCMPSTIYISHKGQVHFGFAAERKLHEERALDPTCRPIRSFKPAFLTNRHQLVEAQAIYLSPDELAAYSIAALFKRINEELRGQLGSYSFQKNFTVPVQFLEGSHPLSERLKNCMLIAEQIAHYLNEEPEPLLSELRSQYFWFQSQIGNLPQSSLLRHLSEPSAAAWDLIGNSQYESGYYCLIDAGAGTTDITFFEKLWPGSASKINIGSAVGVHAGGSQLDDLIEGLISKKLLDGFGLNIDDPTTEALEVRFELNQRKREIKENLFTGSSGLFSYGTKYLAAITKDEFLKQETVRSHVSTVDIAFRQALKLARTKFGAQTFNRDFKGIYLVGGGSQLLSDAGIRTTTGDTPLWQENPVILQRLQPSSSLVGQIPSIIQIYSLSAPSIGASSDLPQEILPSNIPNAVQSVCSVEDRFISKDQV